MDCDEADCGEQLPSGTVVQALCFGCGIYIIDWELGFGQAVVDER
jgi:hypothetical protein